MEEKVTKVRSPGSTGFNELLEKLIELKSVYEINSNLVENRDEEIELLKTELEATKNSLSITQLKLDETKKSLKHELKVKSKFRDLYRKSQKQLKVANKIIDEKTSEISEMEDFILQMHEPGVLYENTQVDSTGSVGSSSSGEEALFSIDEGPLEVFLSPSRVESKATLSPIPEEVIDDIPDYYDEM